MLKVCLWKKLKHIIEQADDWVIIDLLKWLKKITGRDLVKKKPGPISKEVK